MKTREKKLRRDFGRNRKHILRNRKRSEVRIMLCRFGKIDRGVEKKSEEIPSSDYISKKV